MAAGTGWRHEAPPPWTSIPAYLIWLFVRLPTPTNRSWQILPWRLTPNLCPVPPRPNASHGQPAEQFTRHRCQSPRGDSPDKHSSLPHRSIVNTAPTFWPDAATGLVRTRGKPPDGYAGGIPAYKKATHVRGRLFQR